ncbi:MAG: type I-E CRISPR-associated protein Cas7/Cse4/CasC [Faecalibacterium prausnitzii]
MDMALFGRMVADDPSLKYNAAAQVAHSISTHAVKNEYDYFTAVDDCQTDSTGAGHLGTVEYNSSTLYRYATVNVLELAEQLGAEQAAETVRAFGEAFLFSMPTGRQNSFANRTLPDAVYVTLREDQPVNLCGAFERAVSRGEQGGYAEASKAALAQYAQQVYASFVETPPRALLWAAGWKHWLRHRRQKPCWTRWKRLSGMRCPEMRWSNGNAVASAGSAFAGVGRGLQI